MGFSRKFIFYHDCKSKAEFNFEISLKTCQESVLKSNLHITNQYLLFGILILKCNFHIQTSLSLVFYFKMQFTHEKSSISFVFHFYNAIYKPSACLWYFIKKCILHLANLFGSSFYTLQTQPLFGISCNWHITNPASLWYFIKKNLFAGHITNPDFLSNFIVLKQFIHYKYKPSLF